MLTTMLAKAMLDTIQGLQKSDSDDVWHLIADVSDIAHIYVYMGKFYACKFNGRHDSIELAEIEKLAAQAVEVFNGNDSDS